MTLPSSTATGGSNASAGRAEEGGGEAEWGEKGGGELAGWNLIFKLNASRTAFKGWKNLSSCIRCPPLTTTQLRSGIYPVPSRTRSLLGGGGGGGGLPHRYHSNGMAVTAVRGREGASGGGEEEGVTRPDGCVCVEGYTAGGEGQGACVACAAGFWKSWTGSQACASCHELSTSAPSSTAPTDCYCLAGFQPSAIAQNSSSGTLPPHPLSTPAASVAEVANLKCEACPAGQYKQLSGDVACVLCPPGICLSIYR